MKYGQIVGIKADADTLCIEHAARTYGEEKIEAVINGESWPSDNEGNEIVPILWGQDDTDEGSYCSRCGQEIIEPRGKRVQRAITKPLPGAAAGIRRRLRHDNILAIMRAKRLGTCREGERLAWGRVALAYLNADRPVFRADTPWGERIVEVSINSPYDGPRAVVTLNLHGTRYRVDGWLEVPYLRSLSFHPDTSSMQELPSELQPKKSTYRS